MERTPVPFEDWVLAVFDPTASDPWPPPAQDVAHLTQLFSDPEPTLSPFTDEEIGIGLWSVLDSGGAGTALSLNEPAVPLPDRLACITSIPTLYHHLFVPRCKERLGHLSEQDGRLEMACYMFWDIAAFGGAPDHPDGERIEGAVLAVLDHILHIEHAACQESAVHGLGHRVLRHPDRVPALLDRWLASGTVRDDRLRPYAQAARDGCIL